MVVAGSKQTTTSQHLEDELCELMMAMIRRQRRREFGLSRSRLTARERLALDELGQHGAMTMGELSKACHTTASTLTTVVDRLVRKGYVTRSHPENNRKQVVVTISEDGQRLLDEHRNEHLAEVREILAPLSPAEQQVLVSVYRRLAATLD